LTYSDVGAISLRLTDTSFGAIDTADTPLANRTLTTTDLAVGRFVPDAYQLSLTRGGRLATGNLACMASGAANTFYGQGISWQTTPQITVTALNAAGNTVQLWAGSLMKLTGSAATPSMAASNAGSATLSSSFGAVSVSALGGGLARLESNALDRFLLELPTGTVQSSRTPGWSFALALSDTSEAVVAGNPTLSASLGSSAVTMPDGGSFHSGRVSLAAAYGDARAGVRTLVQLQRYTDAGWVTITEDQGCVTVAPQNLVVASPSGVFNTAAGLCAAPMSASVSTKGGRAWLSLPATPGGAVGRLRLQLAGPGIDIATDKSCNGNVVTAAQPLNLPWLMGGSAATGPANMATWGLPTRDPTLRREFWAGM
jgi:hypothetical protein